MSSDRSERYAALRKVHPEFIYESFSLRDQGETLRLDFHFCLTPDLEFRPTLEIQKPPESGKIAASPILLENLAFHIGLIELLSYWKAACPPVLKIRAGFLSAAQISFWKEVYFSGLGEFFYVNKIIALRDDFLEIVIDSERKFAPKTCPVREENLIPIGGGKDSLVTLDLLQPEFATNSCFLLNPTQAQWDSAHFAGYAASQIIEIYRHLDPRLLRLNECGYLNGHTPFSALLGFVAVFVAAVYGKKRIVLSNESSANESTVRGTNVNHQWSKSFTFERRLHDYVHRHLTPDLDYFSLLRPWNELQIARHLARRPESLAVFRSCNVGQKTDTWCGQCSKCLFVNLMLAPFLERSALRQIFSAEPLDDLTLAPLLERLAGATEEKPFECVGTVEEVRAALSLLAEREPRPKLVEFFLAHHAAWRMSRTQAEKVWQAYQTENLVPAAWVPRLQGTKVQVLSCGRI